VSDEGDAGDAADMAPAAGLVWVEGSALTTVVTTPAGLILEIRPPRTALWVLPVYGPIAGSLALARS